MAITFVLEGSMAAAFMPAGTSDNMLSALNAVVRSVASLELALAILKIMYSQ